MAGPLLSSCRGVSSLKSRTGALFLHTSSCGNANDKLPPRRQEVRSRGTVPAAIRNRGPAMRDRPSPAHGTQRAPPPPPPPCRPRGNPATQPAHSTAARDMHSLTVTLLLALSAGTSYGQQAAVAEAAPLPAPAAQAQFGGGNGGFPPYHFFPPYFNGFNGFGGGVGVGGAQGSSSDASSSSVASDAGGGLGGVGGAGAPQQVSFSVGYQPQSAAPGGGGFQGGYRFGFGAAPVGGADSVAPSVAQPAAAGGSIGFYGAAPALGSASPFLGSAGGFGTPSQLASVPLTAGGRFAFGSGEGGAGAGGQFSAPQPQLPQQFAGGYRQFAPPAFGGFGGYQGAKSGAASEAGAAPSQAAASSAPGGALSKHSVTSIQDEITKRQ
ncbi:cuticlin 2-like [Schistocerca cancellata]|uniref:cuticlin 2-like n=1 Tax=Schistocerca cancellata TaxID=274614 RepID=UPI0021175810|nr:cuticlin 2-like [Schistocerca cancellata]